MNKENIEIIQKLINKEAIFPLKRYIKKYLKSFNLNDNENICIETVNLLYQANYSIQNTYKLLKSGQIVDAATLMRSIMEKTMMAMMIYFEPETTYNEFISLKKCGKINYTKPTAVLNNFRLHLKEISPFLFEDFSDDELKLLLEETYEKLCLYTHSSVAVSMMIEVNKNNDNDLFIAFFYLIVYFLEILLYCCLKFLNNDKEDHIDFVCLILGMFFLFIKVDKNKLNNEYLEKYKFYLHWDLNNHFGDKYKDLLINMKNDMQELQNDFNKNEEVLNAYICGLIKNKS